MKRITIKDFSVSAPAGVIYVGTPTALEVELTPSAANPTNIAWTSSSSSLTIEGNSDGQVVVTAEKAGSYTITGTYKGIERTCTITVKEVVLTGLVLSETSLEMTKDETYSLRVTPVPENASVNTLKWTSTNPEVATVSSNGVVSSVGGGVAKIIVSKGTISDTCEVVVAGDFFMYVTDVFYITSRGVVVTGTIRKGVISRGAEVTLCTLTGEKKTVTVQEIEKNRTMVESASESEEVGLLLSGVEKDELERGYSVYTGNYSPKGSVDGSLQVLNDRSDNVVEAGAQYYCHVNDKTVTTQISLSGFSSVEAGKTLNGLVMTVLDGVKPVFHSGQELFIMSSQGGYVIAKFTVK